MYELMALAALLFKLMIFAILLMAQGVVIGVRLLAIGIPQVVRMIGLGMNRVRYGRRV